MRLLAVGTGTASSRHVENLISGGAELSELHVVSSRTDEFRFARVEEPFTVWRTLPEALANSAFDAAVIAPVSSAIAPAVALCLEAGVPCLAEKPLGVSTADLQVMKQIQRDVGRGDAWKRSRVSFQYRFSPGFAALKETCESGELGEIVGVTVRFSESLPKWKPHDNWRSSYAAQFALGGGVVNTQCHELDLVNRLFGPMSVVGATFRSSERLGLDVEDSAAILLVGQSSTSTFPISVFLDMSRDDSERTIRVDGSKGRARLDLLSGGLLTRDDRHFPKSDRANLFQAVADDFLSQDGFCGASLDEGLSLSELIDSIRRMARAI